MDQNFCYEETTSRLKSGRECLLSFGAESLSSNLLSKNKKIKIYRTVVLYGCETWSH